MALRDSAASGINGESGDDEHFTYEATVTTTHQRKNRTIACGMVNGHDGNHRG